MKKAFIILLAFILAGCTSSLRCKNKIIEDNSTEYSLYIEEPLISGYDDKEFLDSINSDFSSRTSSFSEDFKKRIPQQAEKCELSCITDTTFISDDFISLVTEKNVYTGGAHGNLWKISDNIDFKYKKRLTLSDLFMDEKYIEFINVMIEEIIKENPEEHSDLWQKPVLTPRSQNDFYIKDGKIIIFYQPYDLSYYAKGIIEFTIPIESLRGYIKPEYSQRLK